jgi:hypothetical protein
VDWGVEEEPPHAVSATTATTAATVAVRRRYVTDPRIPPALDRPKAIRYSPNHIRN